jgi:uncharacterized protein YcgI (DUF1989 family)
MNIHGRIGMTLWLTIVQGYSSSPFEIERDQLLRITDLEGQQVCDLVAFNKADHREYLSGAETLNFGMTTRPKPGAALYSSEQRPMFEIVMDDAKGVHDFTCAACSSRYYEFHKGTTGHPNCHDNLLTALRPFGVTNLPNPVNLFQNTPIAPDGAVLDLPALTGPGDAIVLRALMDCVGAVSACSQDFEPAEANINGPGSTPLQLEILEAGSYELST